MNLEVSISIPIKDLLEAFTLFGQNGSNAPPPAIPRKQVALSTPSASSSSPSIAMALRRQNGPVGIVPTWEVVPINTGTGPHGPGPMGRYLVQVSNLSKRINKYGVQLQKLFTERVGPVQCQMEKGSATMAFSTQEQADEAVDTYNGGILELTTASTASTASDSKALELLPKSRSLSFLEDRLGPLSKCGLVRGEGWVTIFRNAMASELKNHRGEGAVEWKGSFIKVYHLHGPL